MKPVKKRHIAAVLLSGLLITGCAELMEKDLSKQTVRLVAPSDGVVAADSTRMTFAWDSLDGAIRYRLQVVSPSFDSIVRLYADTTLNGFFFTIPVLSDKGKYQWRIMGSNNSSATDYSAPRTFTVQ